MSWIVILRYTNNTKTSLVRKVVSDFLKSAENLESETAFSFAKIPVKIFTKQTEIVQAYLQGEDDFGPIALSGVGRFNSKTPNIIKAKSEAFAKPPKKIKR